MPATKMFWNIARQQPLSCRGLELVAVYTVGLVTNLTT